jgi:hypothetical protein
MEAMLRISLYRYFYLKLAKTLCLSYYLLCFLFNKIGEHEVLPQSVGWEEREGGGERWHKKHIHV